MVRLRVTKETIFPFLFRVPSTFQAISGSSNFWGIIPSFQMYAWSMNFPPAPLLMRARVSTILFVLLHIFMGIDKDIDCIFPAVTQYMSSMGEIDVDAILLFKNPLFRLHPKIVPSPLVPSVLLHFEYEPRILLGPFSLVGCRMGEMKS